MSSIRPLAALALLLPLSATAGPSHELGTTPTCRVADPDPTDGGLRLTWDADPKGTTPSVRVEMFDREGAEIWVEGRVQAGPVAREWVQGPVAVDALETLFIDVTPPEAALGERHQRAASELRMRVLVVDTATNEEILRQSIEPLALSRGPGGALVRELLTPDHREGRVDPAAPEEGASLNPTPYR